LDDLKFENHSRQFYESEVKSSTVYIYYNSDQVFL